MTEPTPFLYGAQPYPSFKITTKDAELEIEGGKDAIRIQMSSDEWPDVVGRFPKVFVAPLIEFLKTQLPE